ncbi:uncharacterized protein LOC125660202 isoform X2 [Ostrea edulis]|nr:uncharacterized protein LOC125660202 isoform X2 [Ostrea edulis]
MQQIWQELLNLRHDLDCSVNTGAQRFMDSWATDDGFFVETECYKKAQSYLETHHKLMLKGRSGDGKTAMAMHLVFHYVRKKDFRLSIIHTPAELTTELQRGENVDRIILADNLFASCEHGLSSWEKKSDYIKRIFLPSRNFRTLYFIMTCRSDVLSKVQNMYTLAFIEPEWTVDLTTIDRAEKKAILKGMLDHCSDPPKILDQDLDDIADNETPLIGFPQCAKMFIFVKRYNEKGIDFFQNPIDFLMEMVRKEATKKPATKPLFMLLLLQGERNIEVNNIEECCQVFKVHKIDEHYGEFSGKEYIMVAEKLVGNILRRESGNCFRFSHALYKETVELYFAGENPKFALNYVDICVLLEKVRFKDRIENPRGAVIIDDTQKRKLFVNRVLHEILNGNVMAICRCGIFDDDVFITSFVERFYEVEEDGDLQKSHFSKIANCEDSVKSGNIMKWLIEEGKGKMSSELLKLFWEREKNYQSMEEKSNLLINTCKHDSNIDLLELLLQNGAQTSFCAACNSSKETNFLFHICPLEEAASNKCDKLVLILLAEKATIPHLYWPCWGYLHKAAEHKVQSLCCSEFILTLMKHSEFDTDSRSQNGVVRDHNISQNYLKFGQDVIRCDADVNSFFLICCKFLHLNDQCMDFFKDLNINFDFKNQHQENAYHMLFPCSDDEDRVLQAMFCLHTVECDVNAKDSQGKTPLAICLLEDNVPLNVVNVLLEKGASLTVPDKDGKSPTYGLIASSKEDSKILPILEVMTKYLKTEDSEVHKLLQYTMKRNIKRKTCLDFLITICKENEILLFKVIRWAILSEYREKDIIHLMELFAKEIQYGLVRRNETILTLTLQHRVADNELLNFVMEDKSVLDATFDRGDTLLTKIAKITVGIGDSLECIMRKWNPSKKLLDKTNENGDTMLHLLVQNKTRLTKVIEEVLKTGASIDNKNEDERNVIHCLLLSEHDDDYCSIILNIFKKYSEQFPTTLAAKDKNLYTPVMIAFLRANSRFTCIKLFLENYYKESCVTYVDWHKNNVGHHIATSDLNDENSHWILEKAAKDIKFDNSNYIGQIPLHCEIENENFRPKSLCFLLSKTRFRTEILEKIVEENKLKADIVHTILMQSARQVFTENPFLFMSKCDTFKADETIDSVIEQFCMRGFDINEGDGNRDTPILHACKKNKSLKFIQALVKFGALKDVRNSTDETCLHLCMSSNRDDDQTFELVKFLVSTDIVNSKDHRKETPLMRAAKSDCPRRKAMKHLLVNGADASLQDIDLNSVVHHCIDSPRNDEEVEQLLQDMAGYIDLESSNRDGLTPLNLASKNCKRSRIRTLTWLLKNGADFQRTDTFGRSPFYNAVSCMESMNSTVVLERISRLVLFVTYQVPHNKSDRNGQTPMEFASDKNLSDVIVLLERISPYSNTLCDYLIEALDNFNYDNQRSIEEQSLFEEGVARPLVNNLLSKACHLLRDVWFDDILRQEIEIYDASDFIEFYNEREISNLTIKSEKQTPSELRYGQVNIAKIESSESEDYSSVEGPERSPSPLESL